MDSKTSTGLEELLSPEDLEAPGKPVEDKPKPEAAPEAKDAPGEKKKWWPRKKSKAAPASSAPSSSAPPPKRPSWLVIIATFLSIQVLVTIGICLYWSQMPRMQDVHQVARDRAAALGHRQPDQRLPTGYTTASTMMLMAETLLNKPGGYLFNDIASPALLIDNILNWEYGAVIQLREMAHSLRHEFSRARPQSVERPELIEAEARFNFDHNSWILPSTESQYRQGIDFLQIYLNELATARGDAELFVARQDVLDGFLRRQQRRLGSFSVRLRASVALYEYNPYILTSRDIAIMEAEGIEVLPQKITPWHERDDIFYEVRGSVYVLYHCMLAMKQDFEEVLNIAQGTGQMNRILSELHAASQPMRSPMVLNGREFGVVHNHSLTLAAHLVKAHLAMQDLRILLRGGSDI